MSSVLIVVQIVTNVARLLMSPLYVNKCRSCDATVKETFNYSTSTIYKTCACGEDVLLDLDLTQTDGNA